jgi:hypothetical protein
VFCVLLCTLSLFLRLMCLFGNPGSSRIGRCPVGLNLRFLDPRPIPACQTWIRAGPQDRVEFPFCKAGQEIFTAQAMVLPASFHALHKLSTENFSDQSQHLQHQMITFGFFQTMKFNYGNSFSSK